MKDYFFLFFLTFLSFSEVASQKRVVVMGSSTAAGTGSSSPDSSWVGRLQTYFRQNTSDGLDTLVTNIAQGGQTTYHQMPSGFVSPIPNRPTPDLNTNVTKALSFSPDVVIINLPTNDIISGYTKKEVMDNFRLMYQVITAANVRCYISTSQPRNSSTALNDSLKTIADSIRNNFGIYSIDFWTDLVSTDGLNNIKPEVSAGDGIHVNNLGHYYLFIRARDRNIFHSNTSLPLKLLQFSGQLTNNGVILKWRSDLEEVGSSYELQRKRESSSDFEPIYRRAANGNGQVVDYTWTDRDPYPRQNLYRLKMIEHNKVSYSATINIFNKTKYFNIINFYLENSSSNLVVQINSQKEQSVIIELINISGSVVLQKTQSLKINSNQLRLPVNNIAGGKYFFRLRDIENNYVVRAFLK